MILSLVYVWDMYKFYYPWNDKQFTSLLRTYQLWFPIIFIGMAGSGNWIWEPVWALRTTIYLGPPLCWVSFLYSSVVFHVKYFFILLFYILFFIQNGAYFLSWRGVNRSCPYKMVKIPIWDHQIHCTVWLELISDFPAFFFLLVHVLVSLSYDISWSEIEFIEIITKHGTNQNKLNFYTAKDNCF